MSDQIPSTEFEWSVHPFMESRKKAVLAVVVPPAAALLLYLWMNSAFWAVLGFLLLFSSEFPFFLKSNFRFDDKGVTLRRGGVTISRTWEQVKSFYPDRNGVLLSPFARPMWLENFRGLYLQYGRYKEEVLARVKQRFPAALPKEPADPSQATSAKP
jgi:hypothetical protein